MTTTDNTYRPTFHRDHTVTVWNVYSQTWQRTDRPSDRVLASLDARTRERVIRHCGLTVDEYCPCAWCEGAGVIEDALHGDCECSACNGTGIASDD